MAIAFRANGAVKTGTTSLASMAQPTGTATGDCLVAFVLDHATSGTSAAPTGWRNIANTSSASGRFQCFTAVVGQNSLTGTSWTFSGLTTHAVGFIVGFSGASTDFANQPDVTASVRSNASGTTGTLGITPGQASDMVVAGFAAFASGSTWSSEAVATAPTLTNAGGGANSTFCSVAAASGILAVPAATGASSATMGTAGVNAGILVSIKGPTSATVTPSGVSATSAENNSLGAPAALITGVSVTSAENNPTGAGVQIGTATPSGVSVTSAENNSLGMAFGLTSGVSVTSSKNNPLGSPSGLIAGVSAISTENNPLGLSTALVIGVSVLSAQNNPAASAGGTFLPSLMTMGIG